MDKNDDYDVTGWTMLGIMIKGPVLGWELWKEYVAPRLGVPFEVEESASEYRDFKRTLIDLERRGFIGKPKKARTAARSAWEVTVEGERWWESVGVEKHGADRGKTDVELPMKKWMGKGRLSRVEWRSIMQQVNAGTLEIALRGVSDEDKRR